MASSVIFVKDKSFPIGKQAFGVKFWNKAQGFCLSKRYYFQTAEMPVKRKFVKCAKAIAANEKVFAKKWDLETFCPNVRPDLFQGSITSKCLIKFRLPEQMYVNLLMFNYFRPPNFSQILCWQMFFFTLHHLLTSQNNFVLLD